VAVRTVRLSHRHYLGGSYCFSGRGGGLISFITSSLWAYDLLGHGVLAFAIPSGMPDRRGLAEGDAISCVTRWVRQAARIPQAWRGGLK